MDMSTRARARGALNEKLASIDGSSGSWAAKALAKSEAIGINMVAEETERFGPWDDENYRLADGPPLPLKGAVRDRLLVHARQDVAGIYSLVLDACRQAHLARRYAFLACLLLAMLIVLNIAALAMLVSS